MEIIKNNNVYELYIITDKNEKIKVKTFNQNVKVVDVLKTIREIRKSNIELKTKKVMFNF